MFSSVTDKGREFLREHAETFPIDAVEIGKRALNEDKMSRNSRKHYDKIRNRYDRGRKPGVNSK